MDHGARDEQRESGKAKTKESKNHSECGDVEGMRLITRGARQVIFAALIVTHKHA
jgi:hypothetical protein